MNTAVVTGATSGLGREIALDLARRGWQLILPARSPGRLDRISTDAIALGAPAPQIVDCDLADHQQVRRMCETLAQHRELDLVVNNAAVGGGVDTSRRETNAAGAELRMAVNAITPHLIADLLAGALTPPGRIVQVGSMGQAPVAVDDLNFERDYDGIAAYCRSKLALVMSTIELADRGIPVNVVHPAREMPTRMVAEGRFPIASTLDDGTLPVLRVCLDSELTGIRGRYFHRFDEAQPHEQAADRQVRRRVVDWLEACGSAA